MNPLFSSAARHCRRHAAGLATAWCLALPLQALPSAPAVSVQQQVAAIDARYTTPRVARALQAFSAEGTSVTAWGAGQAVEKISVEALGERGRTLLDYYWQGSQLVAARQRRIDYGDFIMALPKDKPTPMNLLEDEWMEFRRGTLAGWRQQGREVAPSSPAALRRAREVQVQARSFQRLVRTPAPAGSKGEECLWRCTAETGGECRQYRCR